MSCFKCRIGIRIAQYLMDIIRAEVYRTVIKYLGLKFRGFGELLGV